MQKFTEWAATKETTGLDSLGSSDYGMRTLPDNDIIEGQLEQLANRFSGIVENLDEKKRTELLEKFINELKARA